MKTGLEPTRSNRLRFPSEMTRSFFSVGALRVASLPLTVAMSIAFARLLGPDDFGNLSFALSLAALIALPAGIGMAPMLTREIASGVDTNDLSAVNGARYRSKQILTAYSVALIAIVLVPWLVAGLGSIELLAAVVLAPILAFHEINAGILRGLGRPTRSLLPSLLARPLCVILVALTFWGMGHLSLHTALGSQVIGSAAVLGLSWFFIRQALPTGISSAKPRYKDRSWIRSYPAFILIAAMSFFNTEIGILFLGAIGESTEASGMKVAQSAAQLCILPLVAINMTTQTQLATLSHSGPTEKLFQTYARAARLAFFGTLVIAVPIVLFAGPLVQFAYGIEYVPISVRAIQFLAIAQIFNAAVGPSGTLLAMSGNERFAFWAQLIALSATLTLVAILSPLYGSAGASAGITMGVLLKNGFELWFLRRLNGRWLSAMMRSS